MRAEDSEDPSDTYAAAGMRTEMSPKIEYLYGQKHYRRVREAVKFGRRSDTPGCTHLV